MWKEKKWRYRNLPNEWREVFSKELWKNRTPTLFWIWEINSSANIIIIGFWSVVYHPFPWIEMIKQTINQINKIVHFAPIRLLKATAMVFRDVTRALPKSVKCWRQHCDYFFCASQISELIDDVKVFKFLETLNENTFPRRFLFTQNNHIFNFAVKNNWDCLLNPSRI